MNTPKLLSKEEWDDLSVYQRRELVGRPEESYMKTLRRALGLETHVPGYDMYVDWWLQNNTPLGKALK